MSELTDLLIEELREHQKKRPDEPNDNFPMWCHNQYEKWQRVDDSLRFILGIRLVENVLDGKTEADGLNPSNSMGLEHEETETAFPTRDEIAMVIYDVLSSQYGDFCTPTDAADAVLALFVQCVLDQTNPEDESSRERTKKGERDDSCTLD